MEYELTAIGSDDHGIDGRDDYYSVKTQDVPIASHEFQEAMENKFFHSSTHPGAWFCSRLTVYRHPYDEFDGVIVIHNRMDV